MEIKVAYSRPSAVEVNELYDLLGWNREGLRTSEKTKIALERSACIVSARCGRRLVGFGRIIGDSYTAQILDLMTHPEFRHQGIAKKVLKALLSYAAGRFLGIFLIDGSGITGFYEQFGFETADPATDKLMYWNGLEEVFRT